MKKFMTLVVGLVLFVLSGTVSLADSHKATVAECIEMSRLAAEMILQDKDAALAEISKKKWSVCMEGFICFRHESEREDARPPDAARTDEDGQSVDCS